MCVGGSFARWCLILSNLVDYTLPGSSIHGISPGKNTGVDCHFFPSRESSQPRDQTHISYIAGRFFTTEPSGKSHPSVSHDKILDNFSLNICHVHYSRMSQSGEPER